MVLGQEDDPLAFRIESLMDAQRYEKANYDALHGLIEAEALDLLVSEWMDWRSTHNGECALHEIVKHGSLDLLRRALRSPLLGQLNELDVNNRLPLYFAVEQRDLVKARALLDAGAMSRCVSGEGDTLKWIRRCPFVRTMVTKDMDMAILVMTAQGRPFPDGHDKGCCHYEPRRIMPWEVSSPPSTENEAKRIHIMQCGQEMHARRTRALDAFFPFLFCLKHAMQRSHESHRILYRSIMVPLLQELWRQHRYGTCWKTPTEK